MTTSTAVQFKTGDRVEFIEDYGNFMTGDKGTVTHADGTLVDLKMDKPVGGYDTTCCFDYRLKPVEAEREIQVGDIIKFNDKNSTHKGFIGKRAEVTYVDSEKGYGGRTHFSAKLIDSATGWRDFAAGETVHVTNDNNDVIIKVEDRKKFKFAVGDLVKPTGWAYQEHKGQALKIASVEEFKPNSGRPTFEYRVTLLDGSEERGYDEGELEAAPKFNIGDYVEVVNSLYHEGKKGWVVQSPSGWYNANTHINTRAKDGKAEWHFKAENLVKAEEPYTPVLKAGDWAKIKSTGYGNYSGKVFEVKVGDTKKGNVQLNLIDPDNANHKWTGHFPLGTLEKAEKPWEPKFKKGDWIEVTVKKNYEWAGFGKVTREASHSGDSVSVKMHADNGNYGAGKTGAFYESDLLPAEEPTVKFQHKLGDYVEGHSWSTQHDGVLYKVVGFAEEPWGNFYDLENVKTGEVQKRSFSDKYPKAAEAPKPEQSWAEAAKIGETFYTVRNGKLGRVLVKTGEDNWVLTYPATSADHFGQQATVRKDCTNSTVVGFALGDKLVKAETNVEEVVPF